LVSSTTILELTSETLSLDQNHSCVTSVMNNRLVEIEHSTKSLLQDDYNTIFLGLKLLMIEETKKDFDKINNFVLY
jgi:hypothetical protein